jgi:hypothetical protein
MALGHDLLGPGHEIAVRSGDISGLGRVGLSIVELHRDDPFAGSVRTAFPRPMRSPGGPQTLPRRHGPSGDGRNAARCGECRQDSFPFPAGSALSIYSPSSRRE